ncbi:MAG: ankyrin repeat domain-containing protein [Flavobacteriales bacterium]|nr:ankyrin repeat domain-containing protein [Flavobacteriales bacterium]
MISKEDINRFIDDCYEGNYEAVQEALDNYMIADCVDEHGTTPLLAAINGEQAEIVGCLTTWGADVNKGPHTALHELFDYAIDGMIQNQEENINPVLLEILEELLACKADLHQLNSVGKRPIDSLNTYSATPEAFNKLKDQFRPLIPKIDEIIEFEDKN